MKRKLIALFVFQSFLLAGFAQPAKEILEKTLTKLNSVEKIEYNTFFHLTQTNLAIYENGKLYLDFSDSKELLGPKYHLVSNSSEEVFNGEFYFSVNKKVGTILVSEKPNENILDLSGYRSISFYKIKKLLPQFLSDTSINIQKQNDTIINGENNYNISIALKNPYKLGELRKTVEFILECNLFISKNSFFPTQFNCRFANEHFLISKFTDINLLASRPDSIWKIERFSKEFSRMNYDDVIKGEVSKIKGQIGEKAPDWKLPMISGDSVQLSGLRGNLVLLEFWFPGCSGCIAAVPDINNLQNTYSKKGLKIYGVEFTGASNAKLEEYIRKHKIKYPTLYSGIKVGKWYGVHSAPKFVLIDKKGIIQYFDGFNLDALIKAIEQHI